MFRFLCIFLLWFCISVYICAFLLCLCNRLRLAASVHPPALLSLLHAHLLSFSNQQQQHIWIRNALLPTHWTLPSRRPTVQIYINGVFSNSILITSHCPACLHSPCKSFNYGAELLLKLTLHTNFGIRGAHGINWANSLQGGSHYSHNFLH